MLPGLIDFLKWSILIILIITRSMNVNKTNGYIVVHWWVIPKIVGSITRYALGLNYIMAWIDRYLSYDVTVITKLAEP